MQTAADVPVLISSDNSSSERRISPSWSVAQFRTRLEPITGVPASAQKLSVRVGSQHAFAIETANEETTQLAAFQLPAYAEIYVEDLRPPNARINFTDTSNVEKYVMPDTEYESRTDSVLAWKKNKKLGRFDPNAPDKEEQKLRALEQEVEERNITLNARARLLPPSDARLGTIAFIGPVPALPAGLWIGVALDEPTGKNDGSVEGERYFECKPKCGVFVRPERVEVGDWGVDDLMGEEDLEEI
ncbi:hypothetical protein K402DRAFT_202077 [Aulographum hederae CBS 113979]|uniref:CAP-Gly domain-containing protein n=1 Tax=Aulographum hederae CBS 113979 TaxID=1176131 RepID=A0A6G1HCN0_9PEZI|nr:hypothetical protein K402DRAFT_202077 [Aulographum hederae CBS 113979]